ncbi:hypothetical protein BDQ17DRAFT_231364 [Cyathus striatus]|nr:hypothetical protein BDQ17DRAFT_231364 [Cyathus striatus]
MGLSKGTMGFFRMVQAGIGRGLGNEQPLTIAPTHRPCYSLSLISLRNLNLPHPFPLQITMRCSSSVALPPPPHRYVNPCGRIERWRRAYVWEPREPVRVLYSAREGEGKVYDTFAVIAEEAFEKLSSMQQPKLAKPRSSLYPSTRPWASRCQIRNAFSCEGRLTSIIRDNGDEEKQGRSVYGQQGGSS